MQITIELNDDQVEALNSFLSTQVEQVQNPVTGNVTNRPRFKDVEDFILFQTSVYVGNAMKMYPPTSAQADLLAIKEAEARIAGLARPMAVVGLVERGQ